MLRTKYPIRVVHVCLKLKITNLQVNYDLFARAYERANPVIIIIFINWTIMVLYGAICVHWLRVYKLLGNNFCVTLFYYLYEEIQIQTTRRDRRDRTNMFTKETNCVTRTQIKFLEQNYIRNICICHICLAYTQKCTHMQMLLNYWLFTYRQKDRKYTCSTVYNN